MLYLVSIAVLLMMPISNDTWPAKRALEKLSYFIIKMYKFLRIKTQIHKKLKVFNESEWFLQC